MKVEEYKRIAYSGHWSEFVSMEDASKEYDRHIEECRDAVDWHSKKDRPLYILAIHGSGRSSFTSCARELSNSQMLLHDALGQFANNTRYTIKEIPLREYNINLCNNCYATTSALCGFVCDCWPVDPMQELYPLILRCDALLISTGVNQSAMAGRLKIFLDRCISLDGGFYRDKLRPKDADFKDRCVALSISLAEKKALPYDARMWGRAGAYFITSKDEKNTNETVARPFESKGYIQAVAESLRDGQADYGIFHDPEEWYASAASDPNEEMSFDKRYFATHSEFREKAARVAKKAVELAEKLRKNPPPFDNGARPQTRT